MSRGGLPPAGRFGFRSKKGEEKGEQKGEEEMRKKAEGGPQGFKNFGRFLEVVLRVPSRNRFAVLPSLQHGLETFVDHKFSKTRYFLSIAIILHITCDLR